MCVLKYALLALDPIGPDEIAWYMTENIARYVVWVMDLPSAAHRAL